jgi:hypothetical protein
MNFLNLKWQNISVYAFNAATHLFFHSANGVNFAMRYYKLVQRRWASKTRQMPTEGQLLRHTSQLSSVCKKFHSLSQNSLYVSISQIFKRDEEFPTIFMIIKYMNIYTHNSCIFSDRICLQIMRPPTQYGICRCRYNSLYLQCDTVSEVSWLPSAK